MFSLITKIAHSTAIKDTIAVARGLYRVASVLDSSTNPREDNWIAKKSSKLESEEKIVPLVVQNKLKIASQQQGKVHTDLQINKIQIEEIKPSIETNPSVNYPKQVIHEETKQSNEIKSEDLVRNEVNYNPSIIQKPENKQSKVISSRFGRIFEYGKLGKQMLETEVEAFVARKTGHGNEQQIYERGAHKITEQLCKMRGAPLKVAQMLSIQQDNLIPAPIRKAFEKARQQAHVMPQSEVKEALKQYFGDDWNSKFKSFEMKPFAAASIGQVHKGVSIEGEDLAVKLQYPGVQKSIHSDIKNLKMLLKLPGIAPKGVFLDKLLANTEKELRQQCNYERQALMHQLYDKCLLAVMPSQYSKFGVPKIYKQLSTRYVMTSKFLKGVGMSRFEQGDVPQHIRNQVGRLLMKLTFSQIFEMGIMQSDPNPSNFTYNVEEKRLNLFDFGATHIYGAEFLNNYCGIIKASVAEDKEEIVKQSILTGFLTKQENSVMLQSHVQSILRLGEPLRWKGIYDFGNQKITEKIYKTIPAMLKNRLKSPPEEIYSLHRKLSGAYLACIRMRSQVDCHKIYSQLKQGYKIQQFL